MTPTLPLSAIIAATVTVSPQSPATPQFNQALILGTSNHIPNATRLVSFSGPTILTQMLQYGFVNTDAEYLAAAAYMAQSPQPQYLIIGRQDVTAIATATIDAPGTGYTVGDVLGVTQSAASGAQIQVTSVGANGVVTGIQVVYGGTGYVVASALPTTGGTGTGFELTVTALGETPLQAVLYCRAASNAWYLVTALAAMDADNIAIAEAVQSMVPQAQLFFVTSSAGVLTGATGNIFSTLKTGNYNRYQGIYATTQGGLAPNNVYAAAALMGVAMGLNTGFASSYFTLAFKQLTTIIPEPVTLLQYNKLQSLSGNVYVNFNNAFNWYQTGLTGTGQFFDQILGLDMLASDLQYSIADLLNSSPSVTQTEVGQSQILHAANDACQQSVARGFLASGTWTGNTITVGNTTLKNGQALPDGFLCFSAPIAQQSSADRSARKSQPVYIAVIEAGSMQSLMLAVYAQQ